MKWCVSVNKKYNVVISKVEDISEPFKEEDTPFVVPPENG